MTPVTTAIDYFAATELRCKGSGIIRLDPRFARALPELRVAVDHAMIPSSVCRSPAHNKAERGHRTSLHLTDNPKWNCATMAADIQWRSWSFAKKFNFAKTALKLGWRVGLHDGFCHIDRLKDITTGYPDVFVYGAYTGKITRSLLLS